ncbi:MAG: hypothetical protein AB7O24_11565 [Kofleriaceae bacterium]
MTRLPTLALFIVLGTTAITGCKRKEPDKAASGTSPEKATTADPSPAPSAASAPRAAPIAINEADWVETNLKTIAPMVNVTMRVPKDAKLEKNGNGGVNVLISDTYMLTVSALTDSKIASAIKSDKTLTVDKTSTYTNTKVLTEEPNGFVYSVQLQDEPNGKQYEPEAHFAFYVEKDGAVYSILDQRPSSAYGVPGSMYTPELAAKVYAIVKSSAKSN